jgi:hypothetical protein
MAILAVLFAIYCVKNTAQDLIYAITGRVPPSFVREQRRMQIAREALAARANTRALRQPITPNRGHRKFFRNAYNDAWETAEERRSRWAEKRARKRHQKWGDDDGIPTPIETNARPEEPLAAPAANAPSTTPESVEPSGADMPTPVVHDDYSLVVGGKEGILYQRYALRRRNGGQPMTTVAVADELGTTVVEAEKLQSDWAARYEQETDPDTPPQHLLEYQRRSKCRDCDGAVTLDKDPERPGQWIVGVEHARDNCAQKPTPREQHDQQVQETLDTALTGAGVDPRKENEKDAADRATREQSLDGMYPDRQRQRVEVWNDPANWTPASQHNPNRSTNSPDTEENDDVTIETTGLQSGLAYNDAMATTCEEGATSVEQSIAALENGEVGQSVTGPMQQGRELLEAAQACFRQAHDELQSHITIKEGYDANPDAGNKAFVTAE